MGADKVDLILIVIREHGFEVSRKQRAGRKIIKEPLEFCYLRTKKDAAVKSGLGTNVWVRKIAVAASPTQKFVLLASDLFRTQVSSSLSVERSGAFTPCWL